jgi:TolA-binding protein
MDRVRACFWPVGPLCLVSLTFVPGAARAQATDEQVARRQLESGRAFARQGNYAEALRDFRAVAETHAATSVADDALLEIARYYLDVADDAAGASAAVDAILKGYATSDSAPDAYVMAGRLALGRGHQPADVEAALANFDRVSRLFPTSSAVPRALQLSGEAFWYAGRFDDALASLGRVTAEFPATDAAADAYLAAGRVLLAIGRPVLAMEELQQVRNRWPDTPAAAEALARITLLHRLYVRAPAGAAYALSAETVGPERLRDVYGLVRTADQRFIWATRSGLGIAGGTETERVPVYTRLQGITVDASGRLVAIDSASLRPLGGDDVPILLPGGDGARALDKIIAARQLSNGHWLVMDSDQRDILRFGPDGTALGVFAAARVTRLAAGFQDQVAALERDGREVLLFNADGAATGRIPLRSTELDFRNPVDLAFDAFGHMYVLDREGLAVFSPYAAADDPEAGVQAGPGVYRLLTRFAADRREGGFDRATAFVVDAAGTIFLYDDRAERILVYR